MTETKEGARLDEPLPMDISDTDRRFAAFVRDLFEDARVAPPADLETAATFMAIAMRGWHMRAHVEERHGLNAADRAEAMSLKALPAYQHEPWLFGYRWKQSTEG